MKNLKVVMKLMILIVVMIAFLVVSGVVSVILASQINDSGNYMGNVTTPALYYVQEFEDSINFYRAQEYRYIGAMRQETRDLALSMIDSKMAEIDGYLTSFRALPFNDEVRDNRLAMANDLEAGLRAYEQTTEYMYSIAGEPGDDEATIATMDYLGAESQAAFDKITGLITDYCVVLNDALDSANEQTTVQYNTAVAITVALIVVSLIVSIIIAFMVIKSITGPLTQIEKVMADIAVGKLNTNIEYVSRDEFGNVADGVRKTIEALNLYIGEVGKSLGTLSDGNCTYVSDVTFIGDYIALNTAYEGVRKKLNNLLIQVSQSSEQVSSGAEEVSAGSQALSQGATEQASSIQELAATIGEISSQVDATAKNAAEANEAVAKAVSDMEIGNDEMEKLTIAMQEISNTSTEIGNIIKTIEDIAFQTNILALNAAVEAARAGEAGKGFAVVADEVRNLASKSADAAKDTTELIESSVAAVANGTEIAGRTAEAMRAVSESSRITSELVGKIAIASEQQAEGINQVTQGVDEISTVVQTNSATAEESAAASEELSGQAYVLKQLLETFVLDESSVGEINL